MWKWDRSMLPAGKLPLRFLFLIGFGIGLSAAYFGRRIWFQTTGILDEDMLYRMKYMTVDSRGLFLYVLCKRCRNFIVLIIMATTYLGLVFCGGITVKYGFSIGFFISTAIYRYGIKGLLLGIVGAFPQYLCYVPAILLLIRWCEDLHRSIYFYHNITGQGKKSLPKKTDSAPKEKSKKAILPDRRLFGFLLGIFFVGDFFVFHWYSFFNG